MIEFIVLATTCVLSPSYVDFQKLEQYQRDDISLQALNCTNWVNKATYDLGYKHEKVFYGWLKNSGHAIKKEVATFEELKKIKAGWKVDFVNNNQYTQRHTVLVKEVAHVGRDYVDVIALGFGNNTRGEINQKMYRFTSCNYPECDNDMYSTVNVPFIATYQPTKK